MYYHPIYVDLGVVTQDIKLLEKPLLHRADRKNSIHEGGPGTTHVLCQLCAVTNGVLGRSPEKRLSHATSFIISQIPTLMWHIVYIRTLR